jgi:hypothetical protein
MTRVRFLVPLALALLLPSLALAGFEVPDYVYRLDQLARAKAEAASRKQPLTFVLSNENTTCPKARAATLQAFNELKDGTVIVFLSESRGAPRLVLEALSSPAAGRFIPKTVVTDSALKKLICVVPYAEESERGQLFREAGQTIAAAAATGGTRQPSDDAGPSAAKRVPASRNATTIDPVIVLRWSGALAPLPQDKLPELLQRLGYEHKLLRAGATECRFQVRGTVLNENFQERLQTFLGSHYQVGSISSAGREITADLRQ